MIRATSRVVAMLAAILAVNIGVPTTSGARTIADVRAEAARIEQQIQDNGDRIAALGEQYNGAVLQLQQLEADQVRAAAKLRVAENRVRSLHTSVAALAVRLYTTRSVGSVAMQSIEVGNFMDYTRSQQYTAASTTKDLDLISHLQAVQVDLGRRRRALEKSVGAARAQRDRLSANRREIEAANATAQRLLGETKGELGRLIHAEEQRRL
ncbi:MAG: hypothetical protein QOH10_94, partial [Actinomycetota bacterium]|nr:hypothetical protein [Actinomycetota bacterium]